MLLIAWGPRYCPVAIVYYSEFQHPCSKGLKLKSKWKSNSKNLTSARRRFQIWMQRKWTNRLVVPHQLRGIRMLRVVSVIPAATINAIDNRLVRIWKEPAPSWSKRTFLFLGFEIPSSINWQFLKQNQNEKANQKTKPQQEDDFKSEYVRDEPTGWWCPTN